jgi:hypothetical protein
VERLVKWAGQGLFGGVLASTGRALLRVVGRAGVGWWVVVVVLVVSGGVAGLVSDDLDVSVVPPL